MEAPNPLPTGRKASTESQTNPNHPNSKRNPCDHLKLEFVIWDLGSYALGALNFVNLHQKAKNKNASNQESKPN
jgi:hypothetical protein